MFRGLSSRASLGILVEDLLGVEGAVVLAHAGVVPADDQVGAAEVLAEHRVEQGFPGTGVAHIQGITGLDAGVLDEIILGEDVDGLGAHFRGDVAGFQFAQELVDQDAVADLDGDLGQVLVGAVHGVPELQGGDGVPSPCLQTSSGFPRAACRGRDTASGRDLHSRP